MEENCPVCSSKLISKDPLPRGGDGDSYDCPLCGRFVLVRTVEASLTDMLSRTKDGATRFSHGIRMRQRKGAVEIGIYDAERMIETPLPKPGEQADLLIRFIAENVEGPGETIRIIPEKHRTIIGARSREGFELIVNHLEQCDLIQGPIMRVEIGFVRADVTPTMRGWEYYEELREGSAGYRKAFIAMEFGNEVLDGMVEDVFKPAVRHAGFELVRLDDNPQAGLIDDRLRVEIQSSDFLLVDLTHDNRGAYWEAGYAEGLGKPVIYLCEESKFEEHKTHFDTNHHLTIPWNEKEPAEAGEKLKATIRATLPHLAK